ncbi:MAG: DNA (cytosine-5-)-methyltransferase [Eubacteriales bacterium]
MQLKTFFDFCSGVGGGRLGLEQCGLKSVGYSDTSRLSVTTYNLMHDTTNEKNFGNLKRIQSENLPSHDILIAGFPCQTFSVIGRKEGFNDDRGQIIFHLARHIKEHQPKCFILENVRGLVTHDKGETLKIILKLLEDCGYMVTYRVLSSIEYGVPQMRQRVYLIGVRNNTSLDIEDLMWPQTFERPHLSEYLIDENNEITPDNLERFSYYLKNPTNQGIYTPDSFLDEEYLIIDTRMSDLRLYRGRVPTLRSHRDGIFYIKNHSIRQLTGYEALLLQGFPKCYADKVKDIVTDRHLLMQAGNAMTVNVIKELGKALINLFNTKEEVKMTNWQDFEQNSTEYLNTHYGDLAKFTNYGGSNSHASDIMVETNHGISFGMEAKHCPAQCGQFVLLPDVSAQEFQYSTQNLTTLTPNSQTIIQHMNENFEEYKEAGTRGKEILFDGCSTVFSNWVIEYYQSKNTKYFITNNYTIFPIEKFSDYFNITATYRVKRSGSSNVGKSNMQPVTDFIVSNFETDSNRSENTKLFISMQQNMHDTRFILNSYEYMFSKREYEYEIRKLSNTFNANVIFSVSLKSSQNAVDLQNFEDALR